MASEIKIRWDGDVPGIEAHRLSLGAFGEPLNQLLAALRRIATQMVSSAVAGEQSRTGRFATLARNLDIEIVSIQGASTGFDGLVAFHQPPNELPLFADLPNRAISEFIDAVERESRGDASNWAVRKYLSSLPPAVNRQTYELYEAGALKKKIEVGTFKLAEVPEEYPSLREIEGHIIGVGFEPGRPEVRIKGEAASVIFDADEASVEQALLIRKEDARALGIHDGKRTKLLRVEPASRARFAITSEAIEEHIFKKWHNVFARLAK
jgi:hypothetical protein